MNPTEISKPKSLVINEKVLISSFFTLKATIVVEYDTSLLSKNGCLLSRTEIIPFSAVPGESSTYLKERSRRSPRDGASSAGIGRSPSVLCWGSRQYGAHERGQQRAAAQRTRSLSAGHLSFQLKDDTSERIHSSEK
ncbi:hypothetical protein TNCT_307231 [Trichonephila clavata]|uniref:Uncharacterized protein n=1 Tax=Trichonephila clavata TaxID=2740835 RepID=A0A8X6H7L2_TRICU|nr:hypothetical protein TNCT_307231 [Trichonephila clavata]